LESAIFILLFWNLPFLIKGKRIFDIYRKELLVSYIL
jgi:hypothetical protein